MATELNETQILTAALITSGIGKPGGVPGAIKSDPKREPGDCLQLTAVNEYVGGLDDIDACYVAETTGSIILAFRGTVTAFDSLDDDLLSFLDWLNDANAEPSTQPGFPGLVHTGFAGSVLGLAKSFIPDIQGRLKTSQKPLVVTGYSKGAALAPLAAWLLNSAGIKADAVHIYEPPRCGNTAFASAFNAVFPATVRYEYQDDLVPHTPPTQSEWSALVQALGTSNAFVAILHLVFPGIDSWDYASVGTLSFVDWNNVIWSEPGQLEQFGDIFRMQHLADDFAQNSLAPLADHNPNGHLFDVVKQSFSCPCACPGS